MLGAHGRRLTDPPPLAKIPKPHTTGNNECLATNFDDFINSPLYC